MNPVLTYPYNGVKMQPKFGPSLGEASAHDIGRCPEISRDTKG
jgi:hypothetical protein